MIGKVVKPGRGFKGLVGYLLDGDRTAPQDASRVSWCELRNLMVDNPRLAPALMRATATKSKRVQSPVYHYVVSWHKNEAPSDDFMKQVADTTCSDLELDDYQRIYIAHDDTDHRHVHIVVNRVHPETGVAWRTSQDYARIEQSLRRQAESHGLAFVPGRHNTRSNSVGRYRRPSTPELRRAEREGEVAAPRWSLALVQARKAELTAVFENCRSWDQLDRALKAMNLQLSRKGQGLVIGDGTGTMKLSQLGKSFRVGLLETKFGEALKDYEGRNEGLPVFHGSPQRNPEAGSSARARAHNVRGPMDHNELPPPESEAWEKLRTARDVTELAIAFFGLGLTTREQLEAALEDQARAQELVDRTKPLLEQLLLPSRKREVQPVRKSAPRRDRGR